MSLFRTERVEQRLKALVGEGDQCFLQRFEVTFPRDTDAKRAAVRRIEQAMGEAFVGTTRWDGFGCWVDPDRTRNPDRKKVCEPVSVLTSAHECGDRARVRKLIEVIGAEGAASNQTQVAVAGTNRFFLVDPKALKTGPGPRAPPGTRTLLP